MTGPIACAGAVIFKGERVLLVRRAKPPLVGQWSIPGGRIKAGERAPDAAMREAQEETGCEIESTGLIDVVDRIDEETGAHFILIDYAARWISGDPRPGDDAAEARFFSPSELETIDLWSETRRIIAMARDYA